VFNDSIDERVSAANRFMHRDLGISLMFPPAWIVKNLPTQVVAINPQSNASLQFALGTKPSGTATEYARRMLGNEAAVEALEIEKRPAAIGSSSNALLGVIYHDSKVFLVRRKAATPQVMAAQRETMKAASAASMC